MSEQLKNKLEQFEAIPPQGTWDKIAIELDETALYKNISGKLINYEAIPPAGIFKNIITVLERDQPKQIAPVRKISSIYTWVAAASVIVAIATVALLFSDREKAIQVAVIPKTNTNQTGVEQMPSVNTVNSSLEIHKQLKQELASNRVLRDERLHNADYKDIQPAAVGFVASKPSVQINPPHIKVKESITELASRFVLNGKYITILGPNGEIKKISLKLFNAVYGQDLNSSDLDHNSLIENVVWEKKLSEWRNKIVQSGYVPSSSNGMDILNLKELIREN